MDIIGQLIINSLISGSLYALASAGPALTYGLLRTLNFAHGHIMMLGAYLVLAVHVDHESSFITSRLMSGELGWAETSIIVLLASMLLGWITLAVFVEPFAKFHSLLALVSTLAFATILESLVALACGVNVRSLSIGGIGQSIQWGGMYITPLQIGIIVTAVIVLGALGVIIELTGFGRVAKSLSEHPHAAETLGVNAGKIHLVVFILSTLLGMLAGILVGYETNLQPTMGNAYTIKAVSAMILGGLGSVWGTIIGSYVLGFVENFAVGLDFGPYSIPSGYKDAFAYLIILLVLLVRPQGLFGRKGRSV